MKKTLLMCLSVVLVVVMLITGTLAYLQDNDSDVNTMTTGNVNIEQLEYERVVDEEGNFVSTGIVDEYTYTPDKLQEFTQGKEALPAVYGGEAAPWSDRTGTDGSAHQQSWAQVGAPGSNQISDAPNVIDKFVFVKNTGKSDVYYRTIVAIEVPEGLNAEYVHFVDTGNSRFTKSEGFYTEINGVRYFVIEYLYKEILTPGEVSRPSLLQVYLDKRATNEDVALFGNTWEILAVSQAIQAGGFDNASAALNEGFGATTEETVAEWFNGINGNIIKVEGNDKAAVVAAMEKAEEGDIVQLSEDTTIAGYAATEKLVIDKAITLDLDGYTLTTESGWGGIDAKGECSIKNGTINHTGNTAAIKAYQVKSIENVTINVSQTAGKVKGGIVVQEGSGCHVKSIKDVTIKGATNGIETYKCGTRADETDLAIGSMENVTIDATDTGILLSAPVGTAKNCYIEGNNIGINMYLHGAYDVSLDMVNCTVTGNTGIYAHDEVKWTNPGSLTLTYDDETTIFGGITQEFEDEVVDRVSIN